MCELCHCNLPVQKHHKIFRSHGGKEGDNLVSLCLVCHNAVHGIKASFNGHSCQTCRTVCHFGQKIRNEEVTLEPWA